MAKYHVNPNTGLVSPCKALKHCRFGEESEHYATEAAARKAFERAQPSSFGEPVSKHSLEAATFQEATAKAFFDERVTDYAHEIELEDNSAAYENYIMLEETQYPAQALNNCFSASTQILEELTQAELREEGYSAAELKTLTFEDGSPHHAIVVTDDEGKRVVVDYTARQYLLPDEPEQAIPWPLVKEEAQWEHFVEERALSRWGLKLKDKQSDWTDVNAAQEGLKAKYEGVELSLSERSGGYVVLDRIVIRPELQKGGVGTKVLEDLVTVADANGWKLALTPSTDFGATSRARLERFYRRFGFVPNKGRHKDFTTMEAMVRSAR